MGKGVIILYTQDSRYANAFIDYCGRNEKERLTVKAFTNSESLTNYLNGHRVELLLAEEELMNEQLESFSGRLAVLSDEKYVNSDDRLKVYKLQRIDSVFKQIYKILASEASSGDYNCIALESETEIIGVFSPCYPQEREQFAREAAMVYGCNQKVLYVNMAELTSYDIYDEEGISELMYYLQEDDRAIGYKLQTLVQNNDNYAAIPGVKHYRDLHEMDPNDVNSLFTKLGQNSGYKKIIVDIGFLEETIFTIIMNCNKVLMPVCGSVHDNPRIRHLWHDFGLEGRESLQEDIISIELPDWWHSQIDMRMKWTSSVLNKQIM